MTTTEILTELQQALMASTTAATLFGFTVGDQYDSHFSKIGPVSVILYVVAYVTALKETLLERWKEEVRQIADSTRYGTEAWWKATAKLWRDDPNELLTVVDGAVGYPNPSTTASTPVRYAAITAQGNTLTLKVAAADDSGTPIPLTATQLAAFQGYANTIKPLGIYVTALSGVANPLQLQATVTYNPEITLQTVQTTVLDAIDRFCHEMEFGGTLYLGRLTTAVMQVEGVVDFAIASATLLDGSTASVPTPFTRSIVPHNGHCRLDRAAAATSITYIPIP